MANKLSSRGERAGKPLVTWLNSGGRRTSRVIRILETYGEIIRCSELLALQSEKPGPTLFLSSSDKVAMQLLKQKNRARNRLKRQLSPYGPFMLDFAIPQDQLGSGLIFHSPRLARRKLFGRDYPYTERDAVKGMMALADAFLLARIRRCVCCGRWLYAQFSHKNWCSRKCYEKTYESKDEVRERRNERRRASYPYSKVLRWKKEASEHGITVNKLRKLKVEARERHIKVPTLLEQKRRAKKL